MLDSLRRVGAAVWWSLYRRWHYDRLAMLRIDLKRCPRCDAAPRDVMEVDRRTFALACEHCGWTTLWHRRMAAAVLAWQRGELFEPMPDA